MYVSKSNLRLKFISKRKNFYLKNSRFPFDKIFKLIKRNYSQKKISIAGYYPSDYEVNALDFFIELNKLNFVSLDEAKVFSNSLKSILRTL